MEGKILYKYLSFRGYSSMKVIKLGLSHFKQSLKPSRKLIIINIIWSLNNLESNIS